MSVIGLIAGIKRLLVPVPPLDPEQNEPGNHSGKERDAQVDEDALGDGGDRDLGQVNRSEVVTDPGRHNLDEDVGVDGVEEHLEQRVEGDQPRRILRVAPCQVVPDDDHSDAAGKPDQDQPDGVLGLVCQERQGKTEHQEGTDHPVEQERDAENLRVAEDLRQLLVTDLRQRRVHHQDEPEGYRDRGCPDRQVRDALHDAGSDVAQ